MKYFSRTAILVIIAMVYFYGSRAFAVVASSSLVPCDGGAEQPCHFTDLIFLVNNVIQFLLYLILPIAAIIFVYVGFLFLTSGGSTEVKSQAKGIFKKAVIGLLFVLAAWLIVKTILITLLAPGESVSWF